MVNEVTTNGSLLFSVYELTLSEWCIKMAAVMRQKREFLKTRQYLSGDFEHLEVKLHGESKYDFKIWMRYKIIA